MRPLLSTLLATAGLAAVAPSALAADVHTYDVKYVGEATYERVDVTDLPAFDSRREVGATLRWTELGQATFRDGALATSVALTGGVLGQGRETYESTDRWSDGTVVRRSQSCAGENDLSVPDFGLLAPIATGLGPALEINPTANVEILQTCDDGTKRNQQFLGHGEPLLTARFILPREAIGQGKIIQLLEGDGTAPCPMRGGTTTRCSFTWKGELTMYRTGPEAPPAPAPPAPAPPAPSPGPAPVPPAPRVTPPNGAPPAPAAAVTAKLVRGGRSARVAIPCATACRGTVEARVRGRSVAAARFRAPAGSTGRVTLRFDARARRAIARARRVELVVRGTGVPAERLVLRR